MKLFKERYSKKLNKRPIKNKKRVDYGWILKVTLIAFILSFIFSFISEVSISNVSIVISIVLIFVFIGIGVLFDMIGIAVTSAEEKPFHSMAAKKIKGAKTAISLIKNAEKVSSFCNDVIGDVCGIISGSMGIVVANKISDMANINKLYPVLFVTAIVASLTIGGKAFGKSFAVNKSNVIIFKFASFIAIFK